MSKLVAASTAFIGASVAPPAWAQSLGGGASPDIDLARIALSLLLCVLIAFVVALVLRRKGVSWLTPLSRSNAQSIRVQETRRLSMQAELCRFQCGGREYLVLVCAQGATVLREAPVELNIDAGEASR